MAKHKKQQSELNDAPVTAPEQSEGTDVPSSTGEPDGVVHCECGEVKNLPSSETRWLLGQKDGLKCHSASGCMWHVEVGTGDSEVAELRAKLQAVEAMLAQQGPLRVVFGLQGGMKQVNEQIDTLLSMQAGPDHFKGVTGPEENAELIQCLHRLEETRRDTFIQMNRAMTEIEKNAPEIMADQLASQATRPHAAPQPAEVMQGGKVTKIEKGMKLTAEQMIRTNHLNLQHNQPETFSQAEIDAVLTPSQPA